MAKKINPKYIGLHFGLGQGIELKITESTSLEAVQVLESNFPDIYITVAEDVPEDFLSPEIIAETEETKSVESIINEDKTEEDEIIDGGGLSETQTVSKRKTSQIIKNNQS